MKSVHNVTKRMQVLDFKTASKKMTTSLSRLICTAASLLILAGTFPAHSAPKKVSPDDDIRESSYSWITDSLKTIELVNVSVKDSNHAVATVRIGFNNPKGAFEISQVSAVFAVDGRQCFNASTANIIAVEKKCNKTYLADVDIVIPDSTNFFNILNVLKVRYSPRMTLDTSFKVALRGGVGIKLHKLFQMDEIFKADALEANFLGTQFSIYPLPGKFSVEAFDILYIDEIGTDGFLALIEMKMVAPAVMKASPELGFVGTIKYSGKEAFCFESVYKLDIKSGERVYYIPIKGRMLGGFNPCEMLNMLKNPCRESLSIVFEKPRIADGKEVLFF